jgi:REP element-mobilizing transposase RayT
MSFKTRYRVWISYGPLTPAVQNDGWTSPLTGERMQKEIAVGQAFWQRNYYDRIIRDEKEKGAIAEYIRNNPCHWEQENI